MGCCGPIILISPAKPGQASRAGVAQIAGYLTLLQLQFCIGVNDVTCSLERMPISKSGSVSEDPLATSSSEKATPAVLQAVLIASDCRPNLLTEHLLSLAFSRGVPLISIRDGKHGSLRLGELMKIQTALAIGVKVTGSGVNKAVKEILKDVAPLPVPSQLHPYH